MKKLFYVLIAVLLVACNNQNDSKEHQKITTQLNTLTAMKTEEERVKKFAEDYIEAVNSEDWMTSIPQYLQPNSDDFIKEHTAFRKSFTKYHATIKHLTVDGNEVMLWLNVSAHYSETYTFQSYFIKEAVTNIEAKNQAISWDEAWYFDVVDNKFGDKWDFLKDNYAILEGLGSEVK